MSRPGSGVAIPGSAIRHQEELEFDVVALTQRSYK